MVAKAMMQLVEDAVHLRTHRPLWRLSPPDAGVEAVLSELGVDLAVRRLLVDTEPGLRNPVRRYRICKRN